MQPGAKVEAAGCGLRGPGGLVFDEHLFPFVRALVVAIQPLQMKTFAALGVLGADDAGVMLDDSDNGPGLAEIRVTDRFSRARDSEHMIERSRYGTGANA